MSRPLPGHAIPYHLTDAEGWEWIQAHQATIDLSGSTTVQAYLQEAMLGGNQERPWGIVVQPAGDYAQILVWVDGSKRVHVVDVTNMAVVNGIIKPAYESPDAGTLAMLQDFFERVKRAAEGTGQLAAVVAIGLLAWSLKR